MKDDESYKLTDDKLSDVESEIADIFCYLLMIADALGVNPIVAANNKILLNESRYPVDKAKGRSEKYNKL